MFHVKHSLLEPVEKYKALLVKYHRTLDLLSDRALQTVDEKITDSLRYAAVAAEAVPQPFTGVDIGSGCGLPAVPMALALPHCRFHLVERRQRRATFLKILKSQLGLDNVTVHARDVREVGDVRAVVVSALAVGTFEKLYCLSRHLHGETITLLSRKGEAFHHEVAALESLLGVEANSVETTPLVSRGTLVAVVVAGGLACRSSES